MTNTIKVIIKNVHGFRKIYDSDLSGSMYGATCPITSIYSAKEDLDKVIDINPRNQKETSQPSKSMQETLKDSPEYFVFRNRGLTFLAHDVSWDNKTEELEITFQINEKSEEQTNGLADGGHTYEVIKNFIDQTEDTEQQEIKAEIKLDIMVGFDENKEEVAKIVEARNTSTQVRDETLLNYKGIFNPIKNIFSEKSYANNIAYYENQFVDDDNPDSGYRTIAVSSPLSCLMCFDIDIFNENQHPIAAYSSKKKVINWFSDRLKEKELDTIALCKILPQVLELRDYIESQIPFIWNRVSTRFGDQDGVKKLKKNKKLDFSNYEVDYSIPGGFVYPILSSFRGLLEKEKGQYKFKVDPKKIFDQMNRENGKTLIYKLIATDNKDPQKMGKSQALYDSCYGSLKGYYYESKTK